jgi:hypothetical protein
MPLHKAKKSSLESPLSKVVKNFACWLRYTYLAPWVSEAEIAPHPDTPLPIKYSLITAAKDFDKALQQECRKRAVNPDNHLKIYLSLIDAVIYDGIVSYQPITDPILIFNLNKSPNKAVNIFQYNSALVTAQHMKETIDFIKLPILKNALTNFYSDLYQAKKHSNNSKVILDWMKEQEIPNPNIVRSESSAQPPAQANPAPRPQNNPHYTNYSVMDWGYMGLLGGLLTYLIWDFSLDNDQNLEPLETVLQLASEGFLLGVTMGICFKKLQVPWQTTAPVRTNNITEIFSSQGPHDFEEQNRERSFQRLS